MKWWVTGLIIAIGTAVAYALWRRYKQQQQAKQGIGYGGLGIAAGVAAAGAAGIRAYDYLNRAAPVAASATEMAGRIALV